MITKELIQKIAPNAPENIVEILNVMLPKYGIDNKERVACFLGQTAHESGGYTKLTENLNYSAQGLCKTWPKRFPTQKSAEPYHRNPEKIANKVYSNRLGNGNEASGDGWKYRGRGAIQTTGKENYEELSQAIGKELSECVKYCGTLEGAVESACVFWKQNNLNGFVDKNDFEGLTEAVNGKLIGYTERKQLRDIALKNI